MSFTKVWQERRRRISRVRDCVLRELPRGAFYDLTAKNGCNPLMKWSSFIRVRTYTHRVCAHSPAPICYRHPFIATLALCPHFYRPFSHLSRLCYFRLTKSQSDGQALFQAQKTLRCQKLQIKMYIRPVAYAPWEQNVDTRRQWGRWRENVTEKSGREKVAQGNIFKRKFVKSYHASQDF